MILDFEYKSLDYVHIVDGTVKLDWNRLWSNRGHQLGEGMVSPDEKWFYLNIPKNSSSSTKKTLSEVDWKFGDARDFPNSEKIIILRDPITRWISGMSEYLMMYHQDIVDGIVSPMEYDCLPILGEKLGLSLLFDRMTFDDHTERQAVFLNDIDTTDSHWFLIDQNFNQKFIGFLHEIGYHHAVSYDENSSSRDSYEFRKKRKLQDLLNYIIDNNQFYRYNLKEWFWPDYELIERNISSAAR